MAQIRSLRPNVTRQQAIEHFSTGLFSTVRAAISGPLCSVADFYIPFRIFRLEIENARKRETHILAVDSVTGTLMPYVFQQAPAGSELVHVQTRNLIAAALTEAETRRIAETRSQRMLFASGFFRIRELKVLTTLMGEIYLPYWIGFRGDDRRVKFSVMDAVRRRTEGAKVRQLIVHWLNSDASIP
jgi:hypothetical protein